MKRSFQFAAFPQAAAVLYIAFYLSGVCESDIFPEYKCIRGARREEMKKKEISHSREAPQCSLYLWQTNPLFSYAKETRERHQD